MQNGAEPDVLRNVPSNLCCHPHEFGTVPNAPSAVFLDDVGEGLDLKGQLA